MGNCSLTITSDSQGIMKNGITYVRLDGKYILQSFIKCGPIRPSQKLLHMHANFPYLLEYATNKEQAWDEWSNSAMNNRFCTKGAMVMSGLVFEYDIRDSPGCTYKIGKILCEEYPPFLRCAIFATKHEAKCPSHIHGDWMISSLCSTDTANP
jgi:hypothetical protein